MNIITKSIYKN